MYPSQGLVNSLNAIREISSEIYHQYIPEIDANTPISTIATPILNYAEVRNSFISALVNKIVYTQYNKKMFKNPLKFLEGDQLPLGYAVENAYINPAKGRQYNGEDFAGLLAKYDADVKSEYFTINSDLQFPVTVNRSQLKKAFTSYDNLEGFITGLTMSLYNGATRSEYENTKALVSTAYANNRVIVETISDITDKSTAEAFVEKARAINAEMQVMGSSYNAWSKISGDRTKPVVTWTAPEDIVFLTTARVKAKLDVILEAGAYNLDKAQILGKVVVVDNFDIVADDGTKVFDGSAIKGIMADKAWFKIKTQDQFMDTFYNANNRTVQNYLNLVKSYGFSLFANAVVFATSAPTVHATAVKWSAATANIEIGGDKTFEMTLTPNETTDTISYAVTGGTGTAGDMTITPSTDTRTVKLALDDDVVANKTFVVTATCNSHTDTITITAVAAS